MAKTATRGSTTGRAATKSKPGPKPGSTRKPRAAKTFKLYASDGGDQLAYLVTEKGKKGTDAIQSAIEKGLVAPDIKFVALEIEDLVPHEVEATVNYAVKPVGRTVKRRGRPPKAATVNGTAPVIPAPTTATTAAKPATKRRGKPGPKPGAKLNKDGTPRKKPGPKAGSTRRAAPKAAPVTPAPAIVPPSSPAAAGNPFADAA